MPTLGGYRQVQPDNYKLSYKYDHTGISNSYIIYVNFYTKIIHKNNNTSNNYNCHLLDK